MTVERDQEPGRGPESEEFLRLILESLTDYAVFSMDTAGRITSWNAGAERVLGLAEDEILGCSADVIFTPEDCAEGMPARERQCAAEVGRANDQRWTMRADGTRFWASGLMLPLAEPGLGFIKILRDRTEQHCAEQRLRENEERFRLLATHIPQLVFRSKGDGLRTWGSPQWIAFTGLDLGESVGFGWLDAIHPDDRDGTHAAWAAARATGELYVEHRVRRAEDGAYRWHQTRAVPDGPPEAEASEWVGTTTDIHDLRDLKDRQQVLMAELQHRTRNLLAVVQAIATQTARKSDTLEEFAHEFAHRLGALSRVQSLVARADRGDVDLRDLVAAELAAHGAADLKRTRVEGPPVALPASSAQAIGLALHELVTNAVKYGAMTRDEGRLDVLWRVDARAPEARVVLEWKESGVVAPEPPRRKGYGTELIERSLPYQLGAETSLVFEDDGIRCVIAVPFSRKSRKI